MLGIIGAMTEEVLHLKEAMEDVEIRTIATMDFYQGRLKGLDVVVVRSGIGKVNAAICTQILIDQYNVRSEERRVGKECRSRWSPYH